MELFITILQLICGLIVIGIVLFQSGKSAGLSGAIGGVADSFMAKNKAKHGRQARPRDQVGRRCVHRPDARSQHAVIFRAYSTICNQKELPEPRFGSSFSLSHAIRLSSSGRM